MTNITLKAPSGLVGQVTTPYGNFTVGADGSVTVDSRSVAALQNAGFTLFRNNSASSIFLAPAAADLVSISSAAALSVNGARTIAAQPDYARKLQVRLVRTSGDVATGLLTIVGTNPQGQTISEVVSLVTAGASLTIKTVNAFAKVTSATVSALTGTLSFTLGIGVAADLALPASPGFLDFTVFKETVASSTTDTWTVANEAVGTVDAVAGTLSPTTPPDGSHHFIVGYSFSQ